MRRNYSRVGARTREKSAKVSQLDTPKCIFLNYRPQQRGWAHCSRDRHPAASVGDEIWRETASLAGKPDKNNQHSNVPKHQQM